MAEIRDVFTIKRTTTTHARCDCGAGNARLAYQLDRNLRPTHRLLCDSCRRESGWRWVSWERGSPREGAVVGFGRER